MKHFNRLSMCGFSHKSKFREFTSQAERITYLKTWLGELHNVNKNTQPLSDAKVKNNHPIHLDPLENRLTINNPTSNSLVKEIIKDKKQQRNIKIVVVESSFQLSSSGVNVEETQFKDNQPYILDFRSHDSSLTSEYNQNFISGIASHLKKRNIEVIGAMCGDEELIEIFRQHDIPIITSSPKASSSPVPDEPSPSRVGNCLYHHGAVRSGQQLYAMSPMHHSITIIGNVHQGAEIMAEGDIHIYGAMKGRIVAGLSAIHHKQQPQFHQRLDSMERIEGRIFTSRFEIPDLIGISDSFVIVDDHIERLRCLLGKPVMIHLKVGQLAENNAKNVSSSSEVVINCGASTYMVFTPIPI